MDSGRSTVPLLAIELLTRVNGISMIVAIVAIEPC